MDIPDKIKVLLVDDSTFARVVLAKHLNRYDGIEVVGQARDGEEALAALPVLEPDVIIMDVVMPRLDGLSTLERLMATDPRPVIMLSSLTKEGADETIKALTLGAIDFIPKPSTKSNIAEVVEELAQKIRQAAKVTHGMLRQGMIKANQHRRSRDFSRPDRIETPDQVIVIGSSTGGPRALSTVLPQLSPDLKAAYVVVQHMPVGFTKSLAERLDQISSLHVQEAVHGDSLLNGQVLIAPGGYHLELINKRKVTLTNGDKIHGVRPAVDATLSSAVKFYGDRVIGVILTGMGNDGRDGALAVKQAEGIVIAEHQSTCVVWGMPRSVVEAEAADYIVPLPEIGAMVTEVAQMRREGVSGRSQVKPVKALPDRWEEHKERS